MTSGVSSTEPAQPPLLASIVPLLPVWRVDRVFDYLVPDSLELQVGALVRVPFGARRVRGIVVALERRHADRPLQPVLAFLDAVPRDELLAALRRRASSARATAEALRFVNEAPTLGDQGYG